MTTDPRSPADELKYLVGQRKEPARLMRADHPEALPVAIAVSNRIDRNLAEFVEKHLLTLVDALCQSSPTGEVTEGIDFRTNLARALFEARYGAILHGWSDETRDYWLGRADEAVTNPLPSSAAPIRITEADFAKAAEEVARLQMELDIADADHIALWLEANLPDAPLGWLACRIVEAHEAIIHALRQSPAPPAPGGVGELNSNLWARFPKDRTVRLTYDGWGRVERHIAALQSRCDRLGEALEAAREFIDDEPALSDHKCPGVDCESCKRRLQMFATVNAALESPAS